MMDICVFGKYKVKLHNAYSYVSDYDYELECFLFSEDTEDWEKVMDGGELMHLVAELMFETDTTNISSPRDGEIVIEKFEPQDGTGGKIIIKYEPVIEDTEVK